MSAAEQRRAVEAPEGVARLLAGVRSDGRAALDARPPPPLRAACSSPAASSSPSSSRAACAVAAAGRSRPATSSPRSPRRERRPVVVVNATEGEPASSKDRALLRLVPHLVLDGAAAAASALGARTVIVAVAERRGAGERHTCSRPPCGSGARGSTGRSPRSPTDSSRVRRRRSSTPSTARPAKPSVKPPYPFERGVGGAPTLVQNAETLAHVALIARFGSRWFRSLGTEAEPGTALVTLSGRSRSARRATRSSSARASRSWSPRREG